MVLGSDRDSGTIRQVAQRRSMSGLGKYWTDSATSMRTNTNRCNSNLHPNWHRIQTRNQQEAVAAAAASATANWKCAHDPPCALSSSSCS